MNAAMAALLGMAAAQGSAEPSVPSDILAFEQALATFQRICVDTLPSPQGFTTAMNAIGIRWRKVDKTPAEIFGTGNSWQSTLGEISYHNPAYSHVTRGGPACHFEFRPDHRYGHAQAAAALAVALGLPAGRDTGNRRQPQMRWESDLPSGMRIRVFLTSNVELNGGSGARLSISVRHPLPPELERRLREIED